MPVCLDFRLLDRTIFCISLVFDSSDLQVLQVLVRIMMGACAVLILIPSTKLTFFY